jgi:hypothetical protein
MFLADGAAAIVGADFFGSLASRFPRFFSEDIVTSTAGEATIAYYRNLSL